MTKTRRSLWYSFLWGEDRVFVPHRVFRAARTFVGIEASSGIVLLLAAVVALVWANSPWDEQYFDLLHTEVGIDLDIVVIREDLQDWINSGLMTVFFFVMGLEIKRELVHGELSTPRRALLPAAAAFGGMAAPALIFVAFNAGGAGVDGWGIPMATDIAFALGVLSLLSRRIPFSVKIFLLALAIADDIGAILVIAIFYTSEFDFLALAVAGLILVGILTMNRSGVRTINLYMAAGACLWIAVHESGVHATLAGVVLGLMTPARNFFSTQTFTATADALVRRFQATDNEEAQRGILEQLEDLSQGTDAPLERLERALHPWVSFTIVPIFALANAGVAVSGDLVSDAISSPISQGVVLGLILGKMAGIFTFTWVAVRLGLCELPMGARWRHVLGVGLLGGIGFTVSLLITDLAFAQPLLADQAKLGVLVASAAAGIGGFLFLRLTNRTPHARI